MPVSAPADKRFRRARVSPARKRTWRPSWRAAVRIVVALLVVGYGVSLAVDLARSSEALLVTRVVVRGNERMSRGEVLGVLEGLAGANMVTVDLEASRRKLLNSPWVADASIRRIFPGTLEVWITERQPMGIGRIRDDLYLIDETGTIIEEFGPNYKEFDLPIIDGLAAARRAGSTLVDEGRAALASQLLAELQKRPGLAKRVSQIDVTDVRDAVVILKDDTALLRVGDERFVDRIQAYLDLVPALRERVPEIDYVDLRFDERVYVRPQASARDVQVRRAARQKATGGD
jgi:cell division protein FtsQ